MKTVLSWFARYEASILTRRAFVDGNVREMRGEVLSCETVGTNILVSVLWDGDTKKEVVALDTNMPWEVQDICNEDSLTIVATPGCGCICGPLSIVQPFFYKFE